MDWGKLVGAIGDTVASVTTIVNSSYTMPAQEKAQQQAWKLANVLRSDTLRQKGIENRQAQQGIDINRATLGLGQQKFGLEKQAYGEQRKSEATNKLANMLGNRLKDNLELKQIMSPLFKAA